MKGPVIDTQFDVEGVTYVKPTPPMGRESKFFVHGRPRKDSSGLAQCPAVGVTFPGLSSGEWERFNTILAASPELQGSHRAWLCHQAKASDAGSPLAPFVVVPVTVAGWMAWRVEHPRPMSFSSVREYANDLFDAAVRERLAGRRERTTDTILPERYVLVVTEEIGQDKANDVSHIALVRERTNGETLITPLVENVRAFHHHAVTVACAYAVAHDVSAVLWQKDRTYGWA